MAQDSSDKTVKRQAPLPFEPKSKKSAQKTPKVAPRVSPKSSQEQGTVTSTSSAQPTRPGLGIPQVVSNRMATRMAIFCGVPSLLGLLTFPVCYVIVTQDLFELPNVAVVLVSMGFFGLGVVGLSYGVISASWEEELPGSWLGWSEFRLNFGRIVESWQNRKQSS